MRFRILNLVIEAVYGKKPQTITVDNLTNGYLVNGVTYFETYEEVLEEIQRLASGLRF
jgi:hypothetical protein